METQFLDITETAKYLNCHKDTIRRMVNNREITAYRVKSKILLRISDIEQYLESNKITPFSEQIKKINIKR
jgi:excisionase family DNA binding protein